MEAIVALVALNTHQGALTAYGGEYVGQPLFCSTPQVPLYFGSQSPRFIALPFKEYGIAWQCGDLVYVPGHGMFRALDAGPFGDHCVVSGGKCLPIVADVPSIYAEWELSTAGEWINLSAVVRECRARGLCD